MQIYDPHETYALCLCGRAIEPEEPACERCLCEHAPKLEADPILIWTGIALGILVALLIVGVGLILDAAWNFYRTFH